MVDELTQPDDRDAPADASRIEPWLQVAAPADFFAKRRERAERREDREIHHHVGRDLRSCRPLAAAWTPVRETDIPGDGIRSSVDSERNDERPEHDLRASDAPLAERQFGGESAINRAACDKTTKRRRPHRHNRQHAPRRRVHGPSHRGSQDGNCAGHTHCRHDVDEHGPPGHWQGSNSHSCRRNDSA